MSVYPGNILTATAATVSASPTSTRTWQWFRSGTAIPAATASGYVVTTEDIDALLTVKQGESNFLGITSATSAGVGPVETYSPAMLFALNEPGVWYDPSDLTTLYQGGNGVSPVTTPGQTVGLMLDKSQGLVASTKGGQMDGVSGSGFDTPSATANQITGDIDIRVRASLVSWTPAATTMFFSRILTGGVTGDSYEFWISTGGVLQLLTVSGTTNTNVASSAAVGFAAGTTNWVRVTWQQSTGFVNFFTSSDGVTWTQNGTANRAGTTSATNAGSRPLRLGARSDGVSGSFPLNGTIYRAQIYNGINGTLAVDFNPTLYTGGATYTAATGEVWTITGENARIVPNGNHAVQATFANRPLYGIVPFGGRRNLQTWSEVFGDSAWTKTGCTVPATQYLAPDGAVTADALVPTGTGFNIQRTFSINISGTYTASVSVKDNGAGSCMVAMGTGTIGYLININLTTGAFISGRGYGGGVLVGYTITSQGNGWWRVAVSATASVGGVSVSAADGTSPTTGILIWGAQLETGSTATAYQRVTTQYDVTEAGVQSCSYLFFDGADSMSTSTITPGTDKAQVFAGVRKLVDAASIIVEFGTASSSLGAFFLNTEVINTPYGFSPRGARAADANDIALVTGFVAPDSAVLTAKVDLSDGQPAQLRRNAGAYASSVNTTFGTGNFLAHSLYIGARSGGLFPFNGNLFSLITRFGPNLDATTINATEYWVGDKTGINIANNTSLTIFARDNTAVLDRFNQIIERRA
jgi:hypothetical protein